MFIINDASYFWLIDDIYGSILQYTAPGLLMIIIFMCVSLVGR